jgi:hypothetical protein
MYVNVYLFFGKMLAVVGAAGGRDVIECLLETSYVVLYESNTEGDRGVSRSRAPVSESFWRI